MACQKYTLYIYCKGFTRQIIVVCGVFRYNISAESPAKSTLSQGQGLSTGGVSIYIYILVYIHIYIYIIYVGVICYDMRPSGSITTMKALLLDVNL